MNDYLIHAGKKGMKWGYNDGRKNGKRTAEELFNQDVKAYNDYLKRNPNANSTTKSKYASELDDTRNSVSVKIGRFLGSTVKSLSDSITSGERKVKIAIAKAQYRNSRKKYLNSLTSEKRRRVQYSLNDGRIKTWTNSKSTSGNTANPGNSASQNKTTSPKARRIKRNTRWEGLHLYRD